MHLDPVGIIQTFTEVTLPDGSTAPVPMMAATRSIEHTRMGATDVVRLPYVGGGVNLSFRHENFDREVDGRSFDFGNFDLDNGVNFLAGFEHRNNLFVEFVASAYSSPHVRIVMGVNFW